MNIIEIANLVRTEGAQLIRNRKEEHIKGNDWQYDTKPLYTGSKRGWQIIDSYSASALLAVYNGLNADNQSKFARVHINKLLDFCWSKVA